MKLSRILIVVFAGVGLMIMLNQFLPSEEERESRKLKYLEDRNFLEKQLVGKWNHSDFGAGLENDRNYHLLSADASYSYRGSDLTKTHGGKWFVEVPDSILYLDLFPKSNSETYKIIDINTYHIALQRVESDSLTKVIKWFKYP